MMRLIDSDNLKPDAQWDGFYNCYSAYSISQIDDAPTVQAVPIEVLQEIRQEIEKLSPDYPYTDDLLDRYVLVKSVFEIIDSKIKELSK